MDEKEDIKVIFEYIQRMTKRRRKSRILSTLT